MDWFFDSAYHLSCPYDSVNSLLNTLDADCAHAPVPQQRRVRSEMSSLFFHCDIAISISINYSKY